MKHIKIPEMLSYTKGPKQVRHSHSRPSIIPKGGKTWEQKCLDELLETERNIKRQKPTVVRIYNKRVPKVKRTLKEIQFGCVRGGYTSYHTVKYYE